MKKYYLLLLIFCATTFLCNAQYTEMPNYEKKKPWTTEVGIVGIGTGEKDVMISLTVSGAYNFNADTYLEFTNPSNGVVEKIFMTDIRRETGEYAMRFASMGYDYLTLTFPPLPNGVNKINLIADKPKVYGISIRPVVRKEQSKSENLRIASTETEVNELIKKSNTPVAGIYENTFGAGRFAIVKEKESDNLYMIYVGDIKNNAGWKFGERTAVLRPTTVNGLYKASYYENDSPVIDGTIAFDATSMTIIIGEEDPIIYIRMGNANTEIVNHQTEQWSGTGYAIGNGYVVTNNHVPEGAKIISVKGVKGDMNTGYTAEVVATDKINDIAILRISDSQFAGFGTIPYAVQQRMADVGEDVFVLGYPLTQALGNEIKLTNGIISSRTGYQGNISTYQMSAPVQPGNSGGPMFDNKGNIIGIVVAGVPGAENVGYAIKTSYLNILIESAGLNIKLPSNNTISTLSLAEKVKRVKNFVFYIECSK